MCVCGLCELFVSVNEMYILGCFFILFLIILENFCFENFFLESYDLCGVFFF